MIFWKTFLAEQDKEDDVDSLIAAVEYQLTQLLSSEAPLMEISSRFKEVDASNLRFGLDNLQSISSQMNRDEFAGQVEKWVKAFEPRLAEVSVEVYERDEQRNRINFSLVARLKTQTGSRALMFDSNINLADQKVEVEGQDLV